MLLYEFKADIERVSRGARPGRSVRTLADLIAFNDEHREREMPYFGQELFEQAAGEGPLTDPAYVDALATCRRLSRGEGIDAVMDAHRLDAIVAPTGGPAWTIDLVNGDHFIGGSSTPAAVAGYPHITVPGGSCTGCRWGSRSSAAPGASRR